MGRIKVKEKAHLENLTQGIAGQNITCKLMQTINVAVHCKLHIFG